MNRATLYHNIDKILAYIKDANAPSTGDMFCTREQRLALEMTPQNEWPLAKKLIMERRALGTWISAHPMELVKGKYEHRVEHKIRDIPDLLEGPTVPTNLAFIVKNVSVIKNKIVIVAVEDETGSGELSAFSSDCDPWWHLLKRDQILIAQCIPRHNGKFSSMHFLRLHKLGELTE